jgi:nucleotide-binding universal stress UspA family protein
MAAHDDAIRRYLGGVARAEENLRRAKAGERLPSIVVGVNAAGSYAAVDEAVTEAALRGWPLRIVHIEPHPHQVQPTTGAAVRHLLDEMYGRARSRAPEVPIEVERLFGPVAPTLLEQSAAGLLVLGSSGSGTLVDFVMGSVVTDVLTHATGPVALVRTAVPAGAPGQPRPVVVGVDGSPAAQAAAAFAAEEARLRKTLLVAIHVPGVVATPLETEDPLWAGPLHASAANVRGLTILRRREHGSVRQVLVEASSTAAVLVIGAFGGRHSYHGSTSQAVIRHARCPLFVTREAAAEVVVS